MSDYLDDTYRIGNTTNVTSSTPAVAVVVLTLVEAVGTHSALTDGSVAPLRPPSQQYDVLDVHAQALPELGHILSYLPPTNSLIRYVTLL